MEEFIIGLGAGMVIWFIWSMSSLGGGEEMVQYDGELFEKNWDGIKRYQEKKLWNLHEEEREWMKEKKRDVYSLFKKFRSVKLSSKEKDIYVNINKWNQQLGKIVWISGILEDFFGGSKVKDRVWEERKWKVSKDGNKVVKNNKKSR